MVDAVATLVRRERLTKGQSDQMPEDGVGAPGPGELGVDALVGEVRQVPLPDADVDDA